MTTFIINTLDYFFGFNPPVKFSLQWIVWAFIIAGFLFSFVLIFLVKTSHNSHLRKIIQDFPGKLISISFLLLINLFSRFNRIEVLSMRFITFVLIAGMIIYFYQIYHGLMVKLPQQNKQNASAIASKKKKYHIHKNKKRQTKRR